MSPRVKTGLQALAYLGLGIALPIIMLVAGWNLSDAPCAARIPTFLFRYGAALLLSTVFLFVVSAKLVRLPSAFKNMFSFLFLFSVLALMIFAFAGTFWAFTAVHEDCSPEVTFMGLSIRSWGVGVTTVLSLFWVAILAILVTKSRRS